MKHVKSERLKKLESEMGDLEQWLKLGLVPKKDIDKHREEIELLKGKIEEEKERLQFLKETGEGEEYVTPKRSSQTRAGYTDMPTIPDIDAPETGGYSETGFDMDTDMAESESSVYDDEDEETRSEAEEGEEEEDKSESDEDEESYFSDKNRWKRGGIIDPDANEW
jgi:hypothetical protein